LFPFIDTFHVSCAVNKQQLCKHRHASLFFAYIARAMHCCVRWLKAFAFYQVMLYNTFCFADYHRTFSKRVLRMNKTIFIVLDACQYEAGTRKRAFPEYLADYGKYARYRGKGETPSRSHPVYATLLTGLYPAELRKADRPRYESNEYAWRCGSSALSLARLIFARWQ